MCCFSGKVQEVSGTRIFAREKDHVSQFVVYDMHVRAPKPVAMVLPVPVDRMNGEKALTFINLEAYPEFFEAMRSGFAMMVGTAAASRGVRPLDSAKLEVQQIGAYEASFVPTIADFSRLDERFRLPKEVWKQLPQYKNWGFAVFKLRAGEAKYHPMAFVFDRAADHRERLFFPTVHVHDGKVHKTAKFDHDLYAQPGELPLNFRGWEESSRNAGIFMAIDKTKGIIAGQLHAYRKEIKGMRANEDTYCERV